MYIRASTICWLSVSLTQELPGCPFVLRSHSDRNRTRKFLPYTIDSRRGVRCWITDNVIARDIQDVFRQKFARAANRRVMIAPGCLSISSALFFSTLSRFNVLRSFQVNIGVYSFHLLVLHSDIEMFFRGLLIL